MTPEFSRRVSLERLRAGPFCQEIAANASECAALARRFDLLALDRLQARVELRRRPDRSVLLKAAFEAEFSQSCVVTLEPVPGSVAGEFSLVYGAAEAIDDSDLDGPAFEPLDGDAIDVGEAVAQELSLVLPEFPRLPQASLADEMGAAGAEPEPAAGPLADLVRWRSPDRE